jgi:simple sugar transport system ATP-binding protein
MKMLYGACRPDAGEIRIDGEPRRWRSASDAIRCGIGMVHQHFMLGDPYDSLENIWLGAEIHRELPGWVPGFLKPVNRRAALAKLDALSKKYGLNVDWGAQVGSLPIGIRQRIEILKLLYRDARILILDEPTAVLTPQETQELFENLRRLRDEGKTILIITHKLKEVLALSDQVTVFRQGRVVGSLETSKTSIEELATLMVGRKVESAVAEDASSAPGNPVLEIRNLSLQLEKAARLESIGFEVRAGEVVGIAGVEGNGQAELLEALLHPRGFAKRLTGHVRYLGRDWQRDGKFLSTSEIRGDSLNSVGTAIGLIPPDRHRQGLLLDRSVRENFLLGLQRSPAFSKRGILDEAALDRTVLKAMEEFDVRPRGLEALSIAVSAFSGGNQQKLIIAREFERKPGLLIAAQPTRGVDIGAIEFIHRKILEARAGGVGVLLVSSELDEILALSDRILVMFKGRIAGAFVRGQVDEKQLGVCMGGGA